MIDYYGYITTMSWRVSIALEELGLEYRAHSIDLGKGEQRSPEHLARNPFGLVPVIVDDDVAGSSEPVTVFESGAILLYLAEKTGALIPKAASDRAEFYTWFFWVVSGYGAALGRSAPFNEEPRLRLFSGKSDFEPAVYEYFTDASRDAHRRMDERLEGRDYICGDYSMVDIAAVASTIPYRLHGVADLAEYPNLAGWYSRVRSRPAVERAIALHREAGRILPDYYREALFDE